MNEYKGGYDPTGPPPPLEKTLQEVLSDLFQQKVGELTPPEIVWFLVVMKFGDTEFQGRFHDLHKVWLTMQMWDRISEVMEYLNAWATQPKIARAKRHPFDPDDRIIDGYSAKAVSMTTLNLGKIRAKIYQMTRED